MIRPSILLLDEPLSNLDAKLRDEMRMEIRDIQKRLGITAVFVTHDQSEALTMCDKVAVLNAGRLEQLGTPSDLYERPATPFVASFVGRTNKLSGRAVDGRVETAGGVVTTRRRISGPVELMVRPHRMSIEPRISAAPPPPHDMNQVAGSVARTVYAGETVQYEVDVGGAPLVVEQGTTSLGGLIEPGSEVVLRWRVADTMIFPVVP